MRDDMSKQITECYRYKYGSENFRARRRSIRMMDEDALGELPVRESIRAKKELGRSFDFGENLSPLHRWLKSQVGNNWDDVYSQVKAAIPAGTLGDHVIFHLNGYVYWRQVENGGKIVMQGRNGTIVEWHENSWRREFYINLDNVLCFSHRRKNSVDKRKPNFDVFRIIYTPQDKYPDYSRCEFYRKVNGVWEMAVIYDAKFESIPSDAIRLEPQETPYSYNQPNPKCSFYLKGWRVMSEREVKVVNPQKIRDGHENAMKNYHRPYSPPVKGTTDEVFRSLLRLSDEKKKVSS